jgi:hypothetical protein
MVKPDEIVQRRTSKFVFVFKHQYEIIRTRIPFRQIRNPGQQNKVTQTTKRINSGSLQFCPKIYRTDVKSLAV